MNLGFLYSSDRAKVPFSTLVLNQSSSQSVSLKTTIKILNLYGNKDFANLHASIQGFPFKNC